MRYNQKESPVKGLNYGFFTLHFFKFRAFRTLHLPKRHVFLEFLVEKKAFHFSNRGLGFSTRVFFHRHWQFTGQQGKGGDHRLFHSSTSTRSRTFRHLFATLHVRWLSRIFNRNACVYKTATRWDLPPYRITIWLIDWWCNVCLFTWWIDSRFLLTAILTLETGGFELASTITLALQANWLTKCASHPKCLKKSWNLRFAYRDIDVQKRTFSNFWGFLL